MYFLSFRIFEQLGLALRKTELPCNISLYRNIFLSSRIFEQLALALKTEFALKFFKPGGAAALPASPPRTPMISVMKSSFHCSLHVSVVV